MKTAERQIIRTRNFTFQKQKKLHANSQLKVKQPFPSLESWEVAAILLSFFGYSDEVVDLLQKVSRTTRVYALSHHYFSLMPFLKVSRWHTQDGPPDTITYQDIIMTDRCQNSFEPVQIALKKMIVQCWNNKCNTSPKMVVQQIANTWKKQDCKEMSDISHFAIIVKK